MTDPTRRPNPNAGKPAARPQPAAAPRPAAAKPAAKAPAPAPAPRPAARPAAPAPRARPVEDDPPPRAAVRRQASDDEALDPTTKKGLIAAAVMVIIAAVVWIVISNQKKDLAQKEADLNAMIQGFLHDIETVVKDDHATKEACQAAIERIDAEKDKYMGRSTEPTIIGHRSRLVGKIADIDARVGFETQYKIVLAAVENPAAKSSDDLINARKTAVDLQGQLGNGPPDAEEKLKAAIVKFDQVLVGKMREEAKTFTAASSTTPRQGLAKYAMAEDYVRKAIEDAKKANNKVNDAAYTEIYKGLLQDSDEYSVKVITPEFIETIPWRDLLADGSKWSKVTNVPGFSCRVENGTLVVSPPDPGSKLLGIAGILDQPSDNLRHFQLDMDFTCDGTVTTFFHVAPPPGSPSNLQSETYDLAAKDGYLKAGAKYNLAASYIGSDLAVRVTGNDDSFPEYRPDRRWSMRRKGGIAFVIPEGARLRVTKMRLKELR